MSVAQHVNEGRPTSAYIHVPFCAHHCGYCDFAIAVGKDHLADLYVEALTTELSRIVSPLPMKTLFLGGGTPSHLSRVQLERLLGAIVRSLPVGPGHEFSIECNPGTLDADKVAVLADHGVTRVSLGVQSFQPELLRVLERNHVPDDIPRAVDAARRRIPQLSLDLIFGVPGQTLDQWDDDLERALALEPDHVSTYGLTYEKGTPLWKRREQGEVAALGEDDELSHYTTAMDVLEDRGFAQYEISSFARPGRRCRHNEVYWANEPYYGVGMGAARYVEGRRELNSRDLNTYIKRIFDGEPATFQSERLEGRERALETVGLNLRRVEGIDRRTFAIRTGFSLDELTGERLWRLIERGFLVDDGTGVRLSREGRCVADAVIEDLMRAC